MPWPWACISPPCSCRPETIGFVLAAALAGTLGLTAIIGIWGDRIGRRRLLVIGSALMLLSAVIPLVGANPVLLALIGCRAWWPSPAASRPACRAWTRPRCRRR